MPDTNWPADLERRESEQSGELACDVCGKSAPLARVVAYGIETMACAECRGEPPPLMDQIVAICRAGHERALRKIADPHETIECLFCGDVHTGDCDYVPSGESYSAWRAQREERWWAERSKSGEGVTMDGWRPISEAPKDGTVILVYRPSGTPDSNYCGMIGTDSFGTVRTYPNDWADSPQNAQPTHWMPLPPPPDAPGSPQLGQPNRSRHEAALDIAVQALGVILRGEAVKYGYRNTAEDALAHIAALVPDAVRSC